MRFGVHEKLLWLAVKGPSFGNKKYSGLRKYVLEPRQTPLVPNVPAALDINVLVAAKVEKIGDTQKVNVWRFVPLVRQRGRHGRSALEKQL
jgi:hypothetical protein